MPGLKRSRVPVYHHFVLLIWEERDMAGEHRDWRFSLQDSQKEVRIGFKGLDELVQFLEKWMKDSSEDTLPKEI